jgi:hypothetical protein
MTVWYSSSTPLSVVLFVQMFCKKVFAFWIASSLCVPQKTNNVKYSVPVYCRKARKQKRKFHSAQLRGRFHIIKIIQFVVLGVVVVFSKSSFSSWTTINTYCIKPI